MSEFRPDGNSELPAPRPTAERLGFLLGSGRLSHLLLLALVSASATFVISPGLYDQQIPVLKPEDVGKPFKSTSFSGFKASRDYAITYDAMTEQRRLEARLSVKPVYDFNPALMSDIRQSLFDAFTVMQGIVAGHEREASQRAQAVAGGEEAQGPPSRRKRAEVDPEGELAPLGAKLKAERRTFEQRLFTQLDDEDFAALVAARFSKEVAQAALALVERAYLSPIVGSREELLKWGAATITRRDLTNSEEKEIATALPGLLDVREAEAELDRFASVPGNFLPDMPNSLRRAALRMAKRLIRPNLTVNNYETETRRSQAASSVDDEVVSIKKGQKIIGDGELINEMHLVILRGMRAQTDQLDRYQLQLGGAGIVALLIAVGYLSHRAAFRRFRPTRKDAVLLGALLVTLLGLTQLWVTIADAVHDRYGLVPLEALHYCLPVAGGAMLVRFLLNAESALFFAIVSSALSGVMLGNSLSFGIFALVGSLAAIERIPRAKDRADVFKAGAVVGLVNALTVFVFALSEGKGVSADTLVVALFALGGGAVAAPVLVMTLTPMIEVGFGYASDIKLLELANLNHPALKELIVQAPGTYHHSIIIGSLVENAAEAIGANPLLARSCAYYHDIGKGKNPLYFGENQKGENWHETLAPAMSAVIIRRHVTDGMEMARQYRLPKLVADVIPQHHGTRLVGFFYHKALKEQEDKEGDVPPVEDAVYRYPGPKPQFREAALVMIADAVESSSRSLVEPTSAKLQALVQKIINVIFSEGQLDECDLTLKDLNLIAGSFLHTLEGIYHTRPAYPAQAIGGPPPGAEPLRPYALTGDAGRPDPKRSAGA